MMYGQQYSENDLSEGISMRDATSSLLIRGTGRGDSFASRAGPRTDLNTWNEFTATVDALSRVSYGERENQPPRIGDMLVACWIATAGSNPLQNAYLVDFFACTPIEFATKYMQLLSERCTVEERCRVFAVQSWLSCQLHSDRSIQANAIKELARRRTRLEDACESGNANDPEAKLQSALRERLLFVDYANRVPAGRPNEAASVGDAALLGISQFSPTKALYTVCSLKESYVPFAYNDAKRFDPWTNEPSRDDNGSSADLVGRPPTRREWLTVCSTAGPKASTPQFCSTQKLIVDRQEKILKDKKLFQLIDKTILNGGNDCNGNKKIEKRETGEDTPASSKTGKSGIFVFSAPDEYETPYRRDAQKNQISDPYEFFLDLLDGVQVSWAKLHLFEEELFPAA